MQAHRHTRARPARLRVAGPTGRVWIGLALLAAANACGGNHAVPSEVFPSSTPPLSFLEILPARQVSKIGETPESIVTARDLSGASVPGVAPEYSSSNPAIVLVEAGRHLRAVGVGTTTIRAIAGGQSAEFVIHVGPNAYDPSAGPMRVLSANYIDLSKIERISRFRSTVGHTYGPEGCRSMKHYFQPKLSVDWAAVDIYAPATGTVWNVATDGGGYRIMLRPLDMAAFDVALFHVTPDPGIVKGTWVEAGQHIGRHATRSTMSDIAVTIGTYETGTFLSYFDVMTDAVFGAYRARGVPSREAAIITKAERDADAIACAPGEGQFIVHGTLPDWVELN